MMIGSQDLLVGLAIAFFFFGAKRLPEIARSLGTSMKEFKKGVSGEAEASDSPAAVVPAVANAAASRSCESCNEPLNPEWSHCPGCGALASQISATASQSSP